LNVRSEISTNLIFEFKGEVQNAQGNILGISILEIDPLIKARFMDHIDGMLRIQRRKKIEHFVLKNNK
jgi:hypothetical protein